MATRNITLPPIYNTRSPEQWRIISEHVSFDGKTVLDLGCGYGDIVQRCHAAGARYVHGVDKDERMHVLEKKRQVINHLDYSQVDLDKDFTWLEYHPDKKWDITICFSVLPYLSDPTSTLHWIHQHSTQALIECQLAGDGPGFSLLKGPQDMRRWLDSIGWKQVERIGETTVEDRGCKRGIWLCSG